MDMRVASKPEDTYAEGDWLSVADARQRGLMPSTAWSYRSDSALRYLQRQQRRAKTELHLETAIVLDARGFVALWTRERPAELPR
jgi:hypothetical protein